MTKLIFRKLTKRFPLVEGFVPNFYSFFLSTQPLPMEGFYKPDQKTNQISPHFLKYLYQFFSTSKIFTTKVSHTYPPVANLVGVLSLGPFETESPSPSPPPFIPPFPEHRCTSLFADSPQCDPLSLQPIVAQLW